MPSTFRHSCSIPTTLLVSLLLLQPALSLSSLASPPWHSRNLWRSSASAARSPQVKEKRAIQPSSWVVQDVYQGESFFDDWEFWSNPDPTHGYVNYLNKEDALNRTIARVTSDNKAIMRVDNFTDLPLGQYRDSVRIYSSKSYTGGLFLLDVDRAPWGCGVWPALWTVGSSWPQGGEIDLFEGVNLGTHNQVTFHTEPNCTYTTPVNQTGTVIGTNCDAFINDNSGCGITDPSQTSFGAPLNALGGGVFAMKWDDEGIMAWFFHRSAVPPDITAGAPQPANWGYPTASLLSLGCNPWQYFSNHQIIFDITLCGDWAGSAYATSGCPGTCETQVMTGSNFDNATWIINSLIVWRESGLSASASGVARVGGLSSLPMAVVTLILVLLVVGRL